MAWLGTWAYRIPIVIDADDISADLTHYPVPLVLAPNSGISAIDLTAIFDEIGSSWQKIAVTKADGETQLYVEKELWRTGGTVDYLGSSTRKSQVTASNDSTASSNYLAVNAFDGINPDNQCWCDWDGAQSDGSCWIQWDFGAPKEITEFRMLSRNITKASGFPYHVKVYGSTDPSFNGEEVELWDNYMSQPADDNSYTDWEELTTTGEYRYLRMEILSQRAVAGGTDDGSMSIGEVEFIENSAGLGLLWVSKSDWTISSSTDTEFYLYYDSAQSNNTSYVAAAGSRTEVWNSAFTLRWGMAQDPSGSAPQITDSCNQVNGTSHGSMTTSDLVEMGYFGYGLDFDGSNDYIIAGPDSDFAALTTAVAACTFKVDSISGSHVIMAAAESDTSGLIVMQISDYIRVYDYVVTDSYANSATGILEVGQEYRLVQIIGASSYQCYLNGDLIINIPSLSIDLSTMTDWTFTLSRSTSPFAGNISEARILDSMPATSWVATDELALTDTLVTFSSPEDLTSLYALTGEIILDAVPTSLLDASGLTTTSSISIGAAYWLAGLTDAAFSDLSFSIDVTGDVVVIANLDTTLSLASDTVQITEAIEIDGTFSIDITGAYHLVGTVDASGLTVTTAIELVPRTFTVDIDLPIFTTEAYFGGVGDINFAAFITSAELTTGIVATADVDFASFELLAYAGGLASVNLSSFVVSSDLIASRNLTADIDIFDFITSATLSTVGLVTSSIDVPEFVVAGTLLRGGLVTADINISDFVVAGEVTKAIIGSGDIYFIDLIKVTSTLEQSETFDVDINLTAFALMASLSSTTAVTGILRHIRGQLR